MFQPTMVSLNASLRPMSDGFGDEYLGLPHDRQCTKREVKVDQCIYKHACLFLPLPFVHTTQGLGTTLSAEVTFLRLSEVKHLTHSTPVNSACFGETLKY